VRHQQRLQARIPVCRAVRPPSRTERGELRVPPRQLASPGKELLVLRVRTRPPALDHVHAKRVERSSHTQFVFDGEVKAYLLRAVAERGVVHFHAGGVMRGHWDTSAARASAQASVDAAPPAASTASTAASSSAAAADSPRWSSIRAADSTAPAGLALP